MGKKIADAYRAGWNEIPLFDVIWLIGWTSGGLWLMGFLVWQLGGTTELSLDAQTFHLDRHLLGLRIRRQSFATESIRNLRYQPRIEMGKGSTPSQIKFEAGSKTYSCAGGISDREALDVIDRMISVYAFPKQASLEYLDLSR
jgi:hypothetical protein